MGRWCIIPFTYDPKQAALDLTPATDRIYIVEQDIDNHLIWCDNADNGIHVSKPRIEEISTPMTQNQRVGAILDHDWDFFYRTLSAPGFVDIPMNHPSFYVADHIAPSDIRTLKAAPLSERIRKTPYGKRHIRHRCTSHNNA
jgi:hypothetical protein